MKLFTSHSTATRPATLLLIALLALTGGCESAKRTTTDYNEATNFASYKSYGAIELGKSSTTPPSPTLQTVVQQTLDAQLVVRYTPVKAGAKSDFSLRYFIDELEQLPQPSPVSGGIGVAGGSGGHTSVGTGISLNFPIGGATSPLRLRIVIDVMDNDTGKQVWRGSKIINTDAADQATRDSDVATAVMEIIAAFPPN